jgi:hypothetical protein
MLRWWTSEVSSHFPTDDPRSPTVLKNCIYIVAYMCLLWRALVIIALQSYHHGVVIIVALVLDADVQVCI